MKKPRLIESVAFDAPTSASDAYGGTKEGWTEQLTCRAQFRYQTGGEGAEAGAQRGATTFKVKIRNTAASRLIRATWRMRDVRRSVAYNVRDLDLVSDRKFIWLTVETGVAV